MDHEDFGLVGFYMGKLPLLRRYLRACESLVAESLPELSRAQIEAFWSVFARREHFIKQNVQPAVCAACLSGHVGPQAKGLRVTFLLKP